METAKNVLGKVSRYRWIVLIVIWLVYIINYFDRIAVLTFLPLIRSDLGLTAAQAGLGASLFFFAYAIAQFTGGWLADRIGPKKVMYIAITTFTAVTFVTGFIRNFTHFILVRLGLGFFEGHHFSPSHKAIANWFPKEEKGRAAGFFSTSWAVGPAVVPIIITWLAAVYGSWRPVFFWLAVPGIIGILLLWYFVADKPEEMVRRGRMTQAEADYIEAGVVSESAKGSSKGGLTVVARDVYFWMYCIVLFMNLAIYWGSTTWISSFLYEQHGFSLKTMGALVSLPYAVAFVAMILGGWLTDNVFKNKTRPVLLISYLVSIPVLLYIGMIPKGNVSMIVAMLALMGFFVNLSFGAVYAYPQIRYPREVVGSAVGISNGFGQFGSFVAPLIAGYLVVEKAGGGASYTNVFIFFSAMAVIAAVLTLFLSEKPLTATLPKSESTVKA
ncbi:MFS transporter [Desulfofundulus sp. TPOSR]|uniref:MFS transporter n=1 Tax=Desulfofundulus sp. TPOSR TaxID=2714340 RepID=UPI001A9B73C1|nr:MFS transporter [Desulfofundulus sp. TPOSR]